MSKFSQTWSVLHVAFRESVRPQNILVALIGLLGTICIWHAAGSALLPLDELQKVSPVKVSPVKVSRPVEVSKTLEPQKPRCGNDGHTRSG